MAYRLPVLDNLDTSIVLLDRNGVIVWTNNKWNSSAIGRGCNQNWIGTSYIDVLRRSNSAGDLDRVIDGITCVIDGQKCLFEHEYSCDYNGEAKWYIGSFKSVDDGTGRIVVSHVEVTGLHQLILDAQNQQAILQAAFDAAPIAMFLAGFDRKIFRANPACLSLFGYRSEELVGSSTERLYATRADWLAVGESLQQALRGEHCLPRLQSMRRKSGELFSALCSGAVLFDHSGQPACAIGALQDISAELAKEEAAHRSRSLESLGRLAGGVAHDFNNILTIITGNVMLLSTAPDPQKTQTRLSEIEHATTLATDLAKKLIRFSGGSSQRRELLILNEIMPSLINLLSRLIGNQVKLNFTAPSDLWSIRTDRSEFENAIINLAANARDAMSRSETRHLTITAENATCAENAGQSSVVRPGRYVILTIEDTGCGMSDDVQRRAFEPFFSTKNTSDSAGLGLATVYGFVNQNGGHISIDSVIDRGTKITIHLPASSTEDVATTSPAAHTPELGGKTILVVDDNPSVRNIAVQMLGNMGYDTLEANDAVSAIELIETRKSIDLVVTDIIMPGMSGEEMALRLSRTHPTLGVLLVTGYRSHFQNPLPNGRHCLYKPYTYLELAAAVQSALAHPSLHSMGPDLKH